MIESTVSALGTGALRFNQSSWKKAGETTTMLTNRVTVCLMAMVLAVGMASAEFQPIKVGTYDQEISAKYTTTDSLPSDEVSAVAIAVDGAVFAATAQGLVRWDGEAWIGVEGFNGGPVTALASAGKLTPQGKDVAGVAVVFDGKLHLSLIHI